MTLPRHLHTLDFTLAELSDTACCQINGHAIEVTDDPDGYNLTIDKNDHLVNNPYRDIHAVEATIHYIFSPYVSGSRVWYPEEEKV